MELFRSKHLLSRLRMIGARLLMQIGRRMAKVKVVRRGHLVAECITFDHFVSVPIAVAMPALHPLDELPLLQSRLSCLARLHILADGRGHCVGRKRRLILLLLIAV